MQAIISRMLKNGHVERKEREAEARDALTNVRTEAAKLSEALRNSTRDFIVNGKAG